MKTSEHDEADLTAIRERAGRLREAVVRAGGVTAVARLAGMPVPSLNNYLAGRDLKTSALVKLADASNVSVEWLATGARLPDTASAGAIFGGDIMLRPVNFWVLALLIQSCQDAYSNSPTPTLKQVLEWVAPPYRQGHPLADRPFDVVERKEPKP